MAVAAYLHDGCRLGVPGTAKSARCSLIRRWDRGEVETVSGGSGPKAYVKNVVAMYFAEVPRFTEIAMVRVNGWPMLIGRAGEQWYDMQANLIEVLG